jgi:pSer/pThr/pTyr-binding forkhead associated (FHA) protein
MLTPARRALQPPKVWEDDTPADRELSCWGRVDVESGQPQQAIAGASGEDPLARHSLSPRELQQLLAVERERRPFLALRQPGGSLRLVTLDGGARPDLTIGRRAEMDVAIPWDGEVSALHAELHCRGEEWTILDDGLSTNGTFLNGRRVVSRQRLRDGDRLRIGQTTIAFSVGGRERAQTTVAARVLTPPPALSDTQRRVLVALCRPCLEGGAYATPATNQQIAEQVFLSVDGVKTHLRTLFGKFGLTHLPQNQKRAALVERAIHLGLVTPADLD